MGDDGIPQLYHDLLTLEPEKLSMYGVVSSPRINGVREKRELLPHLLHIGCHRLDARSYTNLQ